MQRGQPGSPDIAPQSWYPKVSQTCQVLKEKQEPLIGREDYDGAKVYPEGMGNAHDEPREGGVDAHSASGNGMGNTHSAPGEEVGNTHSALGKGVENTQSTPGEGMGISPGFTVYKSLPGMHLL